VAEMRTAATPSCTQSDTEARGESGLCRGSGVNRLRERYICGLGHTVPIPLRPYGSNEEEEPWAKAVAKGRRNRKSKAKTKSNAKSKVIAKSDRQSESGQARQAVRRRRRPRRAHAAPKAKAKRAAKPKASVMQVARQGQVHHQGQTQDRACRQTCGPRQRKTSWSRPGKAAASSLWPRPR